MSIKPSNLIQFARLFFRKKSEPPRDVDCNEYIIGVTPDTKPESFKFKLISNKDIASYISDNPTPSNGTDPINKIIKTIHNKTVDDFIQEEMSNFSDWHTHPNKDVLDTITSAKINSWINDKQDAFGYIPEDENDLGQPNGIAIVDNRTQIIQSQIPDNLGKDNVKVYDSVTDFEAATSPDVYPGVLAIVKHDLSNPEAVDAMLCIGFDETNTTKPIWRKINLYGIDLDGNELKWSNIINTEDIQLNELKDAVDKRHAHNASLFTLNLFHTDRTGEHLMFDGYYFMEKFPEKLHYYNNEIIRNETDETIQYVQLEENNPFGVNAKEDTIYEVYYYGMLLPQSAYTLDKVNNRFVFELEPNEYVHIYFKDVSQDLTHIYK